MPYRGDYESNGSVMAATIALVMIAICVLMVMLAVR